MNILAHNSTFNDCLKKNLFACVKDLRLVLLKSVCSKCAIKIYSVMSLADLFRSCGSSKFLMAKKYHKRDLPKTWVER